MYRYLPPEQKKHKSRFFFRKLMFELRPHPHWKQHVRRDTKKWVLFHSLVASCIASHMQCELLLQQGSCTSQCASPPTSQISLWSYSAAKTWKHKFDINLLNKNNFKFCGWLCVCGPFLFRHVLGRASHYYHLLSSGVHWGSEHTRRISLHQPSCLRHDAGVALVKTYARIDIWSIPASWRNPCVATQTTALVKAVRPVETQPKRWSWIDNFCLLLRSIQAFGVFLFYTYYPIVIATWKEQTKKLILVQHVASRHKLLAALTLVHTENCCFEFGQQALGFAFSMPIEK